MDISSINNNVLGEASQAMDCGVYLVQWVRCPTVTNSGVLVGSAALRAVCIVRWWRIVPWLYIHGCYTVEVGLQH